MDLVATFIMESDASQLDRMRQFAENTLALLTQNRDAIDDLILALNEAVTNVIEHGYQSTPGLIRILIGTAPNTLITILYDHALPYDPTGTPSPDITVPLEERTPGGLGVHMMRHLTDDMRYRRTPDGENELTLIKKNGASS